ncbi:uncharacterized protein A1O9_03955 [Exophiala aquamarina CBS 119918]|uniref:Aldehyde dehydrogenase domain-containing protein n=1 Tax=Exophiala aquamarina CBS 119918 TaxID=1182545 RepID=A0A072PGW6_9EURO|nr:uncharacterized protein A1O9_03955 [Exophiala aquamarina CBS 119918]KEF59111.1 hypothetical protein A1O9_03955 [Exophiala aquamarina CBS 119918]
MDETLRSAQVAFHLHVGNIQWRAKQLHRLFKVVVDNRDELFETVRKDINISQWQFELDLEGFVQDVKELLSFLETLGRSSRLLRAATFDHILQPQGVTVIATTSKDPFRHGLCAFAASLAAGNCVVLVYLAGELQQFAHVLGRSFRLNMDFTGARLLQSSDFDKQALGLDVVAQTLFISDDSELPAGFPNIENVRHLPVSQGISVVIVDKDFKSVGNVVAIIKSKLGQNWYESDEPCIVLIDEGIKDQFLSQMNSVQTTENLKKIETAGSGRTMTVGEAPSDLRQALGTIVFEGPRRNKLPVLVTTSLDHSLDCTSALQSQHNLSQVAMFSNSKDNMAYVARFSRSNVFSAGEIVFRPPIIRDSLLTGATFSPEYFSKHRYQYHSSLPLLQPEGVEQIRARYQRTIKPLPTEPRGERIDFFVQMGWFVHGVKTLMGISGLAAAYGAFILARKCLKAL